MGDRRRSRRRSRHLGAPCVALAQSPESDNPWRAAYPEKDESGYAVPRGAADEFLESTAKVDEHDRFPVQFGLALLAGDDTTFKEGDASREQAGVQHDDFEARSIRAMARGHFELSRRWNYQFSRRVYSGSIDCWFPRDLMRG
jgi:hypothetical protein